MKLIVLGAAAGGGFPQWNSAAPACARARAGDPAALPRTQASLAVSGNGHDWCILNAAPDIRQQIAQTPALHPHANQGLRTSPIRAVVLTGGDVDAIAGLLTLRERQPFTLYATRAILDVLDANPIFGVLAPDVVTRQAVALDEAIALPGGLTLTLFAVPGKVPLYLENAAGDTPLAADAPAPLVTDETTVAAVIASAEHRVVFAPGCAAITPDLLDRIEGADALFFDATLWRDDEMIRAGVGGKTGRRMGHMSLSGPEGAITGLAGARIDRCFAIHINNTNPVLLADAPERAAIEAAGWIVTHDDMELSL